jgi:hypothetical protein
MPAAFDDHPSRLLKKDPECFECLSMNGKPSIISTPTPFVLSAVEGLLGVFQQPASVLRSGDRPIVLLSAGVGARRTREPLAGGIQMVTPVSQKFV